MNKRLLITSTDLMMVQFLVPHVIHLSQIGYDIDIACSEVGGRFHEVENRLASKVRRIFKLRLQRSPLSVQNIKGYSELKEILTTSRYDYIWTNEPVMSVVTRLAAKKQRKHGAKVLYMAHGFHFFNRAPVVNWLIYYPVERIMAHHADMICTVNTEDYVRAKKFNIAQVSYIHGIGINTERLSDLGRQTNIRNELNLSKNAFIILSVGELNRNKNQSTIIKALSKIKGKDIHYVLCGKGMEENNLKQLAERLGLMSKVHFLGYRRDVVDICSQSDVYVMPSHREGLPVSSLEAMYCGLPLVTSNIRGLTDVNKDGYNGFLCMPDDDQAYADAIDYLFENPDIRQQMGARNKKDVIPYTIDKTIKEVEALFSLL